MNKIALLLRTLNIFTLQSSDALLGNVGLDPVLRPLSCVLEATSDTPLTNTLTAYTDLYRALIRDNADADLATAIQRAVRCDDNVITQAAARRTTVAAHITQAALRDLEILSAAAVDAASLKQHLCKIYPQSAEIIQQLPDYRTHRLTLDLDQIRAHCATDGVGVFSRAKGFVFTEQDGVVPVTAIDPVRLADLKNYEEQRQAVVDNTRAFLRGLPAQNVLLYGDRGTGKSSTVKAVLNAFGADGLRMIELNKASIAHLDKLIAAIHRFPLKFIIFIDDLSFNEGDNNFGLLKAALEGSLVTRPDNVVIYATSNRRHLVKETFSAREGNEVHHADTLDETLSLSDRFGLTVTFLKPGKDEYLEIVSKLCNDAQVPYNDQTALQAEQWATLSGGRSPRVAKQYVRNLISLRGLEKQC